MNYCKLKIYIKTYVKDEYMQIINNFIMIMIENFNTLKIKFNLKEFNQNTNLLSNRQS